MFKIVAALAAPALGTVKPPVDVAPATGWRSEAEQRCYRARSRVQTYQRCACSLLSFCQDLDSVARPDQGFVFHDAGLPSASRPRGFCKSAE